MSKEFLIYLPFLFFGTILSIQDWKQNAVAVRDLIFFSLSCVLIFAFRQNFAFMIPLIFIAIGVVMFFRKQSAFGIADYVMAFSISLITKSDQWPEFLMLSGFFGIALAIIKRQRKIPFCIAMFLASTILLIFCMLQA